MGLSCREPFSTSSFAGVVDWSLAESLQDHPQPFFFGGAEGEAASFSDSVIGSTDEEDDEGCFSLRATFEEVVKGAMPIEPTDPLVMNDEAGVIRDRQTNFMSFDSKS